MNKHAAQVQTPDATSRAAVPPTSRARARRSRNSPAAAAGGMTPERIAWAHGIAEDVARRLPPSFDLDDLRQEALLAAWRAEARYDPSRGIPFTVYAYRAVHGACLMSARRRHWTAATMEEIPADAETPLRPDAIVERRLPLLWLESRIERLEPRQRQVIELHYVQDVPVSEVALEMGISVGTVHMIRLAALAMLRELCGVEVRA